MKIGILGDKKAILGFRAFGLETFGVNREEDLKDIQEKTAKDFAIVFITEDIAQKYQKALESFFQKTLPAVLVIPSLAGLGSGSNDLKKILERALGSAMVSI